MDDVKLLDDEIKIYDVSFQYRQYLYQFDYKVNLKNKRRFAGIIVLVNNTHYLIPLTSHAKRKDGRRRNTRTTVEIFNESKEIIAALLINNMIPVPLDCYSLVDIDKDKDKDYLNSEYIYLRKDSTKQEIIRKTRNILRDVYNYKDEFMISFCCDFKLLEQKAIEYK